MTFFDAIDFVPDNIAWRSIDQLKRLTIEYEHLSGISFADQVSFPGRQPYAEVRK